MEHLNDEKNYLKNIDEKTLLIENLFKELYNYKNIEQELKEKNKKIIKLENESNE